MEIQALSFDFADTLFPHRPREMTRILQDAVDHARPHLPPFSFEKFEAKFLEVRDRQFAENRASLRENDFAARWSETLGFVNGGAAPDPKLVEECLDAYTDAFVNVMTMPGYLPELFARLAGRYRLCVISNYPLTAPITRTLERDGLTPFLTAVVVSADLGVIKPHPELFAAALRDLGNPPPSAVIHIGDDWDADILGAGKAGMRTIYTRQWRDVTDKHYGAGDIPPIAEIDDLRDLPALLEGLQ